ncbi:MAG: fibronectin type III domain-containing protein [Fibrobacterales bacterium]
MKLFKTVIAALLVLGITGALAKPRLQSCGKDICDSDGNVVVLRGVAIADAKFTATNVNTVEGHYSNDLTNTPTNQLRATLRLASDASKGWHSNIIRIPVHVDDMGWGFGGWNNDPDGWTAFIDAAVDECVLQDIYCLIDYHSTNNWNYFLSNIDATKLFWGWAANRYGDNPNVLFELFNEPVSDLDNHVWPGGSSGGSILWDDFKDDLAQPLVEYIRNDVGATETFLVVGSPVYTHELSGINSNPIQDPAPEERIGYALHIYGSHWKGDPSLNAYVGSTINNFPIIVTEFGYEVGAPCPIEDCTTTDPIDQDAYGVALKNYIKANNLSFTAWVFDNSFRPIMFEDDQFTVLAEGPGYMGRYTKDFLNEEKDNNQTCDPCDAPGRPTGYAGDDQTLFDTDGAAGEVVQFTGVASDDDGHIVSYQWKDNGVTVSTSQNPVLSLTEGIHTIRLKITDNDGNTHRSYARITIPSFTNESCENQLDNGNFSTGSAGWNNWVDETGANATFSTDNNELYANIATAGANWQIQYWNSTDIWSNTRYIVKYSARATSNRDIEFMIEQDGAPYASINSRVHSVTTSMRDYSHTFTSASAYTQAKVGFKFGGRGTSDVIIDNVVFAVESSCGNGDTENPTIPSNLSAVLTGTSAALLTWSSSSDNNAVAGYGIYVNGVLKKSVGPITTTSITGLAVGTTHSITIVAIDAASNRSAQSAAVEITTAGDEEAPTVPTNVNPVAMGPNSVTVTWAASSDNIGVVSYDVFVDGLLDQSVTTASATIEQLTPETEYTITVKAIDAAGNQSAVSVAATVTTDAPADTEAPTAPTATIATATGMYSINLDWNVSTDNIGVVGYDVYQGNDLLISLGTVTSYEITDLLHNSMYTFYVVAKDAAGNISVASATAMATTNDDTEAPTAPTSVTTSATGTTSISVSWTASTDNIGVDVYEIYVDGVLNKIVTTAASTSVTGLTEETSYVITVIALDAAGNKSAVSNAASVTTDTPPDTEAPTAPTSTIATATGMHSINLEWNASSDNIGVVGYDVYTHNELLVSLGTVTSYEVTGLLHNTRYEYHVIAKDAAGNFSVASTIAIANTDTDTEAPTVPSSVTGEATSATSLSLSWAVSTDNVGVYGYNVFVNGVYSQTVGPETVASIQGLDEDTEYVITLNSEDAAGNQSAESTPVVVTTDAQPTQAALLIEAEDYSSKHSSIQTEGTDDVGGGLNIGWISTDRWTEYNNQTLAEGLWKVEVRHATWSTNRSINIKVDGVTKTNYTKGSSTYTGSGNQYQTWKTGTSDVFSIDNGDIHTVKLTFGNGSQNLNWIRFVPVIPDTEAPSTVVGLEVTGVTSNAISLDWSSATDNVGVIGYDVYRNNVLFATTTSSSYTAASLTAETAYSFKVKAKDAEGNTSVAYSASVTGTTDAVPAINILNNGDFSNGTSDWMCNIWGGAASCSVSGGAYTVSISDPGTSDWNIQPSQDNFTLHNGVTYTFAFDARASVNRIAKIKVETDGSPWSDYAGIGSGSLLGTSMARYSYTFTMTETADARIVFNLGATGTNSVSIDNIWLTQGTSDPCSGQVGCP